MSNDNTLDWGTDSENHSDENEIEDWTWAVKPSNDKGISEPIQSRVSPEMARTVDELIMESKGQGIPIKTRADFLRVATLRMIDDLRKFIDTKNENITHWLVLEKLAQMEAYKLEMLERVISTVQSSMKGLNVLARDENWNELNIRLTSYLKPILEMRVANEYVAKLYIRELFEHPLFENILLELKKERGNVSDIIKEAESIHKSS